MSGAPSYDVKDLAAGVKVKTFAPAGVTAASGSSAVDAQDLLCHMPDRFNFGAYSVETASITYRASHAHRKLQNA
jgi:hypothetical protein